MGRTAIAAAAIWFTLCFGTVAWGQTVHVYEILHGFTGNDGHGFTGDLDGANPSAPVVYAPDGYFYGTTINGSASNTGPTGTIYRIDSAGGVTILHHGVLGTNGGGVNPMDGLVRAADGDFYGTMYEGG